MKKIFILIVSFILMMSFDSVFALNGLNELVDVRYVSDQNFDKVVINFSANVGDITVKKLENPKRLMIDFSQSETKIAKKVVAVGNDDIKQVRIGQFNPTTVRIVLDLNKEIKYEVVKNGSTCMINVPQNRVTKVSANVGTTPSTVPASNDNVSVTPNSASLNNTAQNKGSTQGVDKPTPIASEVIQDKNKVLIEYKQQESDECVKIKVNNYNGYNIFRIKNPDRIVVDIPNGFFEEGSNKIRINGSRVKMIRHSNFTKSSARVIIDVAKNPNYEVIEESDGLKIMVKRNANYSTEPGSINYITSGDRVWLKINKTGLTNRQGVNISEYTERYDNANKTYTIMFDKEIANLKNEVLNIDDNYMNKIEVVNNEQTEKTSIIFWAKDDFAYNVISRDKTLDTAITVLKRATKKQNLVVIDAGHGGKEEPGAICNLFYEKHLNLDIALRLEDCLKKKNINTYMIRNSDTYVGLYERANIANKLNARLYISVHNNSFGEDANGTETLYNPNNKNENVSVESRQFASTLQNKLIQALGTRDRGIKQRPNLVVLKHTTMPSALVEVGFITNAKELELLNNNEFRQKAAQAIADAISETLEKIDNM